MRLPVGKYHKLDLSQIEDVNYLKWAIENMEIRNLPVTALYKRILELEPGFVSKKWGSLEEWMECIRPKL